MKTRLLSLAWVVFLSVSTAGSAFADADWPRVQLPIDSQRLDIGPQLAVNGAPMRIQGFFSKRDVSDIRDWFRQSLGQPLVENNLNGKLILGRLQGEHYLSVQLEAVDPSDRRSGTRGLAAVTHLKAAYDSREETRIATERLMSRLPAGSQLASQISSLDGAKVSRQMVVFNRLDESVNVERIKALMQEDGLNFESETDGDQSAGRRARGGVKNGRALFFKGPGKEAIAVVTRDAQGQTAVVMNTVTFVERFK